MSHSLEHPTNNSSTSLRHRLPVRLRHHWKLLIAAIAVCLAIALAFGTSMVRPYITSELVSETVIVNDIDGEAELFDTTTHTIDITFDQAEYEEMLSTFREDGEKEYIRADITIDGTLIEDVGLRLKGNSTLQSLSNNNMGGGRENDEMPEGMELPESTEDTAEGTAPAGPGGMGGGMGGGGMTQLSEENPEELPWLISFDEYEEGRAYQGMTEIALRPAASGYAEESLNELTTRAEKAGDEGAATLAESIRSSLASLSETAPEPSAGMGMGPGRKTATTASETTETTEDV